jgi:hypothetical protein
MAGDIIMKTAGAILLKFGTFCAANPSISIVNAAENILGD